MSSILNGAVLNNKYNRQMSRLTVKENIMNEFVTFFWNYIYMFSFIASFLTKDPALIALKAPLDLERLFEFFAFDNTEGALPGLSLWKEIWL